MNKNDFNIIFRKYVQGNLSPTEKERAFVAKVYESLQNILRQGNCFQIGSYPRFTASTPLHDLDVLYVVGKWENNISDPSKILSGLQHLIATSFQNPTEYRIQVPPPQTHSVTIQFLKGSEEIFSIDIVPAYVFSNNEFGDDIYMVPEILYKKHKLRKQLYEELVRHGNQMNWIKSDPKGYIEVAMRVNKANNDFRKSVKFVKSWKASCKIVNEDFKLKSFHIEQILTKYFLQNTNLEIYDAIFKFFCDLPTYLEKSQIPDRADASRNIDDYIDSFSYYEKQLILQARDYFLIKLEEFSENSKVEQLLRAGFHKRVSGTESYLFDQQIPVLINNEEVLSIQARVLPRQGSFREYFLDRTGSINIDRNIEFRATGHHSADIYKWKVKNNNCSPQPRGEITDHRTYNDPEHTKYIGEHYVECYGIKNGICIARAKQKVVLKSQY